MADGASPTLSPKEAIVCGMNYFNDFMEGQPTVRVLLEGLNLDTESGNWVVTFGFDSVRTRPFNASPFMKAIASATEEFRTPEVEILREFRAVYLSSVDGQFVKLEHA